MKSSRPTYPLLLTKNIIPATEMTEQQMALPGLTNVFIFEETPLRPAWSKDELRSTREKIRNAFESHDTASEAFSCRGFLN